MRTKLILIAIVSAAVVGFVLITRENLDWPVTNDQPDGRVVVAFGDSLTRGFGAADGEAYPDHLSQLVGRPIVNAGKDGDTTGQALARLNRVLAHQPDVVILTLGGNDILRRVPLQTTLDNLRQIIQSLQQAGAMVVYAAVDPPLIGGKWVDAVRDLCREEGVLYVPSVMDGLWSDNERMFDSIHPNGDGYRVLAERIHARLEPHCGNKALVSGQTP